jgi:hypothetical protein
MSTVLRELVAKLGFQVDKSQFDQASAGVEKIKTSVTQAESRLRDARGRFMAMGAAVARAGSQGRDAGGRFTAMGKGAKGAADEVKGLAGATGKLQAGLLQLGLGLGVGALIKKMITLASDANETENVLGEVFGPEGAGQVKTWAADMSKYLGRSEYSLRANAGALGAMLEPMTGSAKKAQEMSTSMATLAVDLASFFNSSDEEALQALKSGLSGEAEPLKRFGIVLQDATLQEYAHSKGITKKVAAMNVAEKTELRYAFILAHTTKAQGDAHRTADGFANASRALGDHIKDLATHTGQKLLPIANKLVVWFDKATTAFDNLSKHSTIVESALGVLAAGFVALKAESALALAGPIIGFALLALLVDDLNTLFTGGESAIGKWLDEVGGIGTATTFVQGFDDALAGVQETWASLSDFMADMPDLVDWWEVLSLAPENFGIAVARWFQKIDEYVVSLMEKVANLGRSFTSFLGFNTPQQQESAAGRATGRGLNAGVAGSISDETEMRSSEVSEQIRKRREERRAVAAELAQRQYADGRGVGAGVARRGVAVRPSAAPGAVSAPVQPAVAASGSKTTTVNNGPINIHIGAGAGSADAARAAKRVADAERRRNAAALARNG